MAAVRQHTVSAFLLERFARETRRGRGVCMLEKATGWPKLVSPSDATVRKLSKIESVAAPLVARLEQRDFPVRLERLELALFVAMCWLRTPVWREQMASVMEQMTAAMVAEGYRLDPEAAQRAFASSEFEMTREEIEQFRRTFVDDLGSGRLGVEMPKNAMIKHFLDGANGASWTLFMLDWTLVRLEDDVEEFIVGDMPVSIYDPAPVFAGGGVGVLSSPHTQMFLPLGPRSASCSSRTRTCGTGRVQTSSGSMG